MTLVLDTSAVLAAVVDTAARPYVLEQIGAADELCASALALTEALATIDALTDDDVSRADLEDGVRLLWDHLHVVPVDQRCLDRAATLARQRPLRIADAIHLAAADRLPAPLQFLTLDPAQLSAAAALGFDVRSP